MKLKKVISIILIVMILLLIILAIIKKVQNNKKNEIDNLNNIQTLQTETPQEKSESEINKKIGAKTLKSEERRRMQIYFGQYMRLIETKQYATAYGKLNKEFRKNNFPDINNFITYYQQNYPISSNLEYESIDRQGDIYVLTVNISDPFNDKGKNFTQRIVLKELSNNDYEISFQLN